MRQWIDLFEGWHNTVRTAVGNVDIFKNPTKSELTKIFADLQRQHNLSPDDWPCRASIGPDGSLYVWDAHEATHSDVINDGGIPTVGGYIYLTPDKIIFNDLNWDYDEESEDPERIYGRWVGNYYRAAKNNASLISYYGPDMPILGIDDGNPPNGNQRFPVTDDFIAKHVAA